MKTVSTKLDNTDFEKFIQDCNNCGSTISEKLRELVLTSLEMSKNREDTDEGIIDMENKIIRNITKAHQMSLEENDDGSPRSADIFWFTDEELEEIDEPKT